MSGIKKDTVLHGICSLAVTTSYAVPHQGLDSVHMQDDPTSLRHYETRPRGAEAKHDYSVGIIHSPAREPSAPSTQSGRTMISRSSR